MIIPSSDTLAQVTLDMAARPANVRAFEIREARESLTEASVPWAADATDEQVDQYICGVRCGQYTEPARTVA